MDGGIFRTRGTGGGMQVCDVLSAEESKGQQIFVKKNTRVAGAAHFRLRLLLLVLLLHVLLLLLVLVVFVLVVLLLIGTRSRRPTSSCPRSPTPTGECV